MAQPRLRGVRALTIAATLLLFTLSARAQSTDLDRTIEKLLEQRYESIAGLDAYEATRFEYGAYITLGALASDSILTGRTRTLRQVDGRFWARVTNGGHLLYGRLRLLYSDWNSGDNPLGKDNELRSPIGDRYWYMFDWRRHRRARDGVDPGWSWSAQIGRQYIDWASGIVLSRTLYALRLAAEGARWKVEGFLGQTVRDSVDFDPTRPSFQDDTKRNIWAVQLSYRGTAFHRPYAYFLSQTDENGTTLGPAAFVYDSNYAAVGSTGQATGALLYRVELIYEWGNSISDGLAAPQTIEEIGAWAGRFSLTHILRRTKTTTRWWFEFETLFGSGDDDRQASNTTIGGNLSGTADNAFNAFGIARTGLALQPELTNLLSFRLSASVMPFPGKGVLDRFRLLLDGFLFLKVDGGAPISVPTLPGESYLGAELDITIEWQVFSDLAVDLRSGVFFPNGSAFGDSDPRYFLFVGISYAF